jgi:hypothetical protein
VNLQTANDKVSRVGEEEKEEDKKKRRRKEWKENFLHVKFLCAKVR